LTEAAFTGGFSFDIRKIAGQILFTGGWTTL
jgi:hypothetical protein